MFLKSFCKSQFHHKAVNLFLTQAIAKDLLTDLWGGGLIENDFKNTACEIKSALFIEYMHMLFLLKRLYGVLSYFVK